MDQSADDRRWAARRKFWFPSGILVDRRAGPERRSGAERRGNQGGALSTDLSVDRRALSDRREPSERRNDERRNDLRRPSDRAQGG